MSKKDQSIYKKLEDLKHQAAGNALYAAFSAGGYQNVDDWVTLTIEQIEKDGIHALRRPFNFVQGSVDELTEIFPMCMFNEEGLVRVTKAMGLQVEIKNGRQYYPAAVWKRMYGLQQTDLGLVILPL